MAPDFELLTRSLARSLRAATFRPKSVELYAGTAGRLAAVAAERDRPPGAGENPE